MTKADKNLKIEINPADYWKETLDALGGEGALLVTRDKQGKPNVMTIGWATMGRIWEKPILSVLVRPTRFTYGLIEENGDFTVNVLPKNLAGIASYCGRVSGRDHNKFAEQKLTTVPAKRVSAPIISECIIHFECKVVHKNNMCPDFLSPYIKASAYPKGDYHRIYFGEILSASATRDAKERVSKPSDK